MEWLFDCISFWNSWTNVGSLIDQKSVRKKVKRNKRVGAHMKQHFLKKGVVVSSKIRLKRIRRSLTTCKGCICFPKDELDSFMKAFKKGGQNTKITITCRRRSKC